MNITDIMTCDIVTVELDDTLFTVKEIFDKSKFHHLLVIENKQLLGVISDRDLLKSVSHRLDTVSETEKDLASLNKKAHQIMSRDLITLTQKASVSDAIKLFDKHLISCIPIVNQAQQPIGIVSWRDIIKVLSQRISSSSR